MPSNYGALYSSSVDEEDELDFKPTLDAEELDGEGSEGEDQMGEDDLTLGAGPRKTPYFSAAKTLPQFESGTKTLRELCDMISLGEINLNPPYQRDDVWTDTQRSALIGSLFRNYHVPTVLFNAHPDPTDPEAIVWDTCDGKQRLTSIYRFFRGELSVKDDLDKKFHYPAARATSTAPHGSTRFDPATKTRFDSIQLRTAVYHNLNEDQERNLFRAVQAGKILSPAEILASNVGPWSDWMKELCDRYWDQDPKKNPHTLQNRIARLTRKNQFRTVLSMARNLLIEPSEIGFLTDSQLSRLATNPDLPSPEEKALVEKILERFSRLTLVEALPEDLQEFAREVKLSAEKGIEWPHRVWRPAPRRVVAPVEVDLLPLIIKGLEQLPDGDLLVIIERCRAATFAKFPKKIKRNGFVIRFIVDWIESFDVATLEHKYKSSGKLRRRPPPPPPPPAGDSDPGTATPPPGLVAPPKSSAKRKAAPAPAPAPAVAPAAAAAQLEEPLAKRIKEEESEEQGLSAASQSAARVPPPPPPKLKEKEKRVLTEQEIQERDERRRRHREEGAQARQRLQAQTGASSSVNYGPSAPTVAGTWRSTTPVAPPPPRPLLFTAPLAAQPAPTASVPRALPTPNPYRVYSAAQPERQPTPAPSTDPRVRRGP